MSKELPETNEMFGMSQYNSVNESYEYCLKIFGYQDHFPKKDARILFKIENINYHIIDILVEKFTSDHDPQYLYKEWSQDIGNCLSDWEKWTLADVLIKLFISYRVTPTIHIKILCELSKITEWRPIVSSYIYRHFN